MTLLFACAILLTPAALIWVVRPLRRWTLRWPLLYLLAGSGFLDASAIALSHTSLDPYFWSPVLLAGSALASMCCAVLVVRAFEWYLWAYWR